MAITLTPDTTKRLHGSIKRFAAEHLDEEMGDLKANLLLDFVLKEIGPSIYNTAIADAQNRSFATRSHGMTASATSASPTRASAGSGAPLASSFGLRWSS